MLELESKIHIASLDVDAQNSFTPICPNELPIPLGHEIVHELNQQGTFAQLRIGTKDAHPANPVWLANQNQPTLSAISGYQNVDVRWPQHCVPGSLGFKLIEGLPHPQDYDYFVWKGVEPDMHPYGACYHDIHERMSTGLIEFLIAHQITTVIVGGLATDYCVKTSVLQLLHAGFKTILNLGACRGLSPHTTQEAIKLMEQKGAILISSSTQLCSSRK
ncbi:nicotinamidase [Candidatus Berkiella cookevillensis]|uniref:nicotinamidase n=1 Tax=Candidatus Berkiella cookevillensis TaxID=437022 RepID=A0A0Q9YQD2_9GAMM|nr:nicotinamidase [Candidatus Berkiella cookevillensis]MCS5707591.1 nicotinamidase [Candidatus Berkiella cookevillensis]